MKDAIEVSIIFHEGQRMFAVPKQPAPVALTEGVTVPMAVLEAAEASLGSFCSDHGWSNEDMQNMDNLSAYIDIARHKANLGITKGEPAPVQEPVAWMVNGSMVVREDWIERLHWPFEWVGAGRAVPDSWTPILYTTPPAAQRQFVGLTDKQMVDAIEPLYLNRFTAEMATKVSMDEFRAIEAKLKEKNT
jgi:hypothetical protein